MQLRPAYPIRTERLALRPFVASDLDAMLDIESREDVVRYLSWGRLDREGVEKLLERRLRQGAIDGDDTALLLAITIPPQDLVVGEIMLRLRSGEHRQGEIGWTLHPDVQGQGYATEAARAMLRLGFEDLGLHRIAADADPRNADSIRLMERLGMRREGVHLDVLFEKGEWSAEIVYAILEDEWRALASSVIEAPEGSGEHR